MGTSLLLVLLGVLRCLPTESLQAGTPRNNILEQQVLGLLEDFRELMISGSDDMPVLDPLLIQHLHVDENVVDLPGSHLTANELVVKIYAGGARSVMSAYPNGKLHFSGHYDVFVSAMGFEIFGKGDGKVQLIGPKVSGKAIFSLWSRNISGTEVRISLEGFEPQLTGLFHHDGASDFVNAFLRNLVPELVEFYEDDITTFLSPVLEDLANQALEDIFP